MILIFWPTCVSVINSVGGISAPAISADTETLY